MAKEPKLTLLNAKEYLERYPLEYNLGYTTDLDESNPYNYSKDWPLTPIEWIDWPTNIEYTEHTEHTGLTPEIMQALAWETGRWVRQAEDVICQYEPEQVMFGTGHRPDAAYKLRNRFDHLKEFQVKNWYYEEDNWLSQHMDKKIAEFVDRALIKGVRCLISGAAIYFDRKLELRWQHIMQQKKYRAIYKDKEVTIKAGELSHVMAIPCRGQFVKWSGPEKARYRRLLKRASFVFLCDRRSFTQNKGCMQYRNEWMVDHAGVGMTGYILEIGQWGLSSGTKNCLQYARQQGKSIVGFHPLYAEYHFYYHNNKFIKEIDGIVQK